MVMVSKEEHLSKINILDEELEHHYKPVMLIDNSLMNTGKQRLQPYRESEQLLKRNL
jgi:hypothetical protein